MLPNPFMSFSFSSSGAGMRSIRTRDKPGGKHEINEGLIFGAGCRKKNEPGHTGGLNITTGCRDFDVPGIQIPSFPGGTEFRGSL
jgi:hypothetical protein